MGPPTPFTPHTQLRHAHICSHGRSESSQASVKGYISLEGASVKQCNEASEAYAFTLTTPARRLSMLTPGLTPGPLKMGPHGEILGAGCPPSLDAKMNIIQKLDNWGRHALRNMLADGPIDAPFTTWNLAAHSATELQSWLDGFAHVLGERAEETSPVAVCGYVPIGDTSRVARMPTLMSEEVA